MENDLHEVRRVAKVLNNGGIAGPIQRVERRSQFDTQVG